MKIKTPYFIIEIEILFIIVFFISILSSKVQDILESFYICYMFILFHELSHMFVASILGKDIDKLKISLAGVCVSFKKEKYITSINKYNRINILKNILIYSSGPIANFILAIIFRNFKIIFEINMFLGILNLIPIYPLDGNNILKNILFIKYKEDITLKILNAVNNVIYTVFSILSIYQIVYLRNPSLIIFLLYIFVIKSQNKKTNYHRLFIKRGC